MKLSLWASVVALVLKPEPEPVSLVRGNSSTPEQLVAYKDHNLAVPMRAAPPPITEDKWLARLKDVTQFESRFIFAPGIGKVTNGLAADLGSSVDRQSFHVALAGASGSAVNLLEHLPGRQEGFVVLGAHYDSVPMTGPAPGAEDNGSGVATVLAIADALRTMGTPEYTIVFALFSAEEEGLLGSEHYVAHTEMSGYRGGIILDEVSFKRTSAESIIFEVAGGKAGDGDIPANNRIIDTLAKATDRSSLKYEVNYHGWGSDHIPFLRNGFPAALVIERDNMFYSQTYAHTSSDVVENLSPAFGARVATVVSQAVWNLANA